MAKKRDTGTGGPVHISGDNTGIVNTGPWAVIVQQNMQNGIAMPPEAFTPIDEVEARGVVNSPVLRHRVEHFVGREAENAEITAAVEAARAVAVYGLGGIGKSTLAARWAQQQAEAYDLVWWISASSQESATAGLVDLAIRLVPALRVLPDSALRVWSLAWLATHSRWLIVLDDVHDTRLAAELMEQVPRGKFLITSRRSAVWQGIATELPLDVLEPHEAACLFALISTPTGGNDGDGGEADDVAGLCAELGFLPLAIEQAARFCREASTTPREYSRLLAAYPADMLADPGAAEAEGDSDEDREDPRLDRSRSAQTIARVWKVTLDRLTGTPLCAEILGIVAWYAPDSIPRSLLSDLGSPPALLRALRLLNSHAMIKLTTDSIHLHRLVQLVSRQPPADADALRERATDILAAALPEDQLDPATWAGYRALVPHISQLRSLTSLDACTVTTGLLITRAGEFLEDQGDGEAAGRLFEDAIALFTRIGGDARITAIMLKQRVAEILIAAGDLDHGQPMAEDAYYEQQHIYGNDHISAVMALNGLASAHSTYVTISPQSAWASDQAIEAYDAALQRGRALALPEGHPEMVRALRGLAGRMIRTGGARKVLPMLKSLLEIDEAAYGRNHPLSLQSHLWVAEAYANAGDFDTAIPLLEQGLDRMKDLRGRAHSQTLAARSMLVTALRNSGSYDQAVVLAEENEHEALEAFGSNSIVTRSLQRELGYTLWRIGRHENAVTVLEGVYEYYCETLPEFDQTRTETRYLFATALLDAGDAQRALPLLEENLRARQLLLTESYATDRAVALTALAQAHHLLGHLDVAARFLRETLEWCTSTLGPDDPRTITARWDAAVADAAAGEADVTEDALPSVYADYRRLLGLEDSRTERARKLLVGLRIRQGKTREAIDLAEERAEALALTLGAEHTSTLYARLKAAEMLDSLGESKGAAAILDAILPILVEGREEGFSLGVRVRTAMTHWRAGQYTEAIRLAEEAMPADFQPGDEAALNVAINLGSLIISCWVKLGQPDRATAMVCELDRIAARISGDATPDTSRWLPVRQELTEIIARGLP